MKAIPPFDHGIGPLERLDGGLPIPRSILGHTQVVPVVSDIRLVFDRQLCQLNCFGWITLGNVSRRCQPPGPVRCRVGQVVDTFLTVLVRLFVVGFGFAPFQSLCGIQ